MVKKRVYAFILIELLIAFFIAMVSLSGFFILQTWTMQKETASLHKAKIWLYCDEIMRQTLLETPLKQTLLKLKVKADFQPVIESQTKTVAITKDMKFTFSYSIHAKCEGEKHIAKDELTRLYTIKICFSYKHTSTQKPLEVIYPLVIKYTQSVSKA